MLDYFTNIIYYFRYKKYHCKIFEVEIMLNKKIVMLVIIFISLFAISTVSAEDNLTVDSYALDGNNESGDVLSACDNNELSAGTKTFTDLNNLINSNHNFYIDLDSDYKYTSSDSAFINGVSIDRSVNIRGHGFTIDGGNQARIFHTSDAYVSLNDINFINAYSDSGGAILGPNYSTTNCNFTNNHASKFGGALYNGHAENCIFTDNSAGSYGGAVYEGSVNNCIFKGNHATDGGAIYNVYATESTFISNSASQSCGAMYGSSAGYCTFIANSAHDHSGALGFGYAIGCTFLNNTAYQSGAVGGAGSAEQCTFKYNSAEEGGAIFGCLAKQCTFIENRANQGGAMAGGNSAEDCVFINNHAIAKGGALLEVYALRCNFTGNHAIDGGAMYLNSAKDSNFIENSAINGGAIFNTHAVSCSFTKNTANKGGAICDGSAISSSFRNNHAINGGAVSGGSAEGSVLACTFISNTAEEYGGAIYATSAIRCYFKSNSAKYGGAISFGSSASESVFVENVAKVSGGAKYQSYAGNSNFTGNLPIYTLYVSNLDSVEGFGGNVKIRLSDSPNNDIIGENVTIKVYNSKNKVIGTYTSQTGYNWFVDLPAGKYRAVLSVNDIAFELDPVRISINILKSSSIYVANVVANYNDGKCLLVNLHDSKGNVIKYTKVSININGQTTTFSTDDNGQVFFSTRGLVPKEYVATVKFAGDRTYYESSASAKVTVKKVNSKIIASQKTFKFRDKSKAYSITLKNNKNVIIKFAQVKITVKGKTYSAKTNARGIAIFKLTKLTKKGIYVATVKFSGNNCYKSVSKRVRVIVK